MEAILPLALPIRGLVKRGPYAAAGSSHPPAHRANATAATKLNGVELDRRMLSAGPSTFQVFTEPVSVPQDVKVTVAIGDVFECRLPLN